jgi:hypothetical protein
VTDINQEWFPFLSSDEFEKLRNLVSDSPSDLMPHQFAGILGIDIPKAMLIITILSNKKITETKLLIYHVCDDEMAVEAMDFGLGFPSLPWFCPNCEEEVENHSELNFDFMSKFVTGNKS